MGPELFNPEKFGLEESRPTKSSDCYALGMVVYEVLSGKIPFHRYWDLSVVLRVYEGERPERPQGAKGPWFTDDIWALIQHCWKSDPGDRPRIKDVLERLEEVSKSWTPSPTLIMADPPTETSATWERESSTEGSADEREVSLASQIVAHQPSQRLMLEGDLITNNTCPSAYRSSALSNDAHDHRALGTTVKNLSGPGARERFPGRVSWVGLFDRTRY